MTTEKQFIIMKKESKFPFWEFDNRKDAENEMEKMRIWHGWEDLFILEQLKNDN